VPEITPDVLVFFAAILVALPAMFVFYKLLESSSLITRHSVEIGGAAAGFLATFLLCRFYMVSGVNRVPTLSREELAGQWEVLNDNEPDLYAVWNFTAGEKNTIAVSGSIWKTLDPTDLKGAPLASFGPYDVKFRPDGKLYFSYDAPTGKGQTEFRVTHGLVGTFVDDRAQTAAGEADEGRWLFYKEGIEPWAYAMRAQTRRCVIILIVAWVITGLSYVLFKFLPSEARLRYKSLKLAGPIAFFYVFLSLCAVPIVRSPTRSLPFGASDVPGAWLIEYFTPRDRHGEATISLDGGNELLVRGHLSRRRLGTTQPSQPRAEMKTFDARFSDGDHTLTFRYNTLVGKGQATLRASPVLRGYYVDDTSNSPTGQANTGELIAVKRLR
jgi:hypothetical protein